MKKILFTLALLLTAIQSYGYKEHNMLSTGQSPEQIKPLLVLNQEWVKYPDYQDREGWDKLFKESGKDYIKIGEKYLDYEWKYVTVTDYLGYTRTGDRNGMQAAAGANISALSNLFMAELAEGKGRFIDQIMNGVFAHCEMTTWALSAHLVKQPTGEPFPNYKYNYIDLAGGGVASLLAWIHYYLAPEFDKVTPRIAERIRYELKRRIIDSYYEDDYFWWMAKDVNASRVVNNWNPWCNANCLVTFMLMENDPERLAQLVYKSMCSVDKFINYTKEDGACEEGPGYWGHAAGKMYDYLELLSQFTNGKISIFDEPMVRAMGEYIANSYVGDNWVVNFADASAKGGGSSEMIYRFGRAVKSELLMSYARSIYNGGKAEESNGVYAADIFRNLEALSSSEEMAAYDKPYIPNKYSWYPQTQFLYMTDPSGLFLASKGGFNAESHNHNDVGSCMFYIDNTPILIDSGAGSYTKQTFSKDRYKLWTMQSDYHNLPRINGFSQQNGASFKASDVKSDARKNRFSLNIATAYPAAADIKSWYRTYELSKNRLLIEDRFSLKEVKAANQINFLTWGDVDTATPGKVFITVHGVKALLNYDASMFTPSLETIELNDTKLSKVWGNKIYRLSLTAKKSSKAGKYKFSLIKQ